MTILLPFLVFAVCTAVLVKSADYFIGAIERIGLSLGLPEFFTGVLFVALGTSLPELTTGLASVWQGEADMLTGNVLGSNVANVLLGLGLVVFLSGKRIHYQKNVFSGHIPILLIATALATFAMLDGQIVRPEGCLLLGVLGSYLWFLHSETPAIKMVDGKREFDWKDFAVAGGALLGILVSSHFLITSVITLAEMLNLAKTALAATLVALGTSLPEMVVVYAALKNGNPDIAIGNVLGSNIFNIVLILGLGAVVAPLPVSELNLTVLLPFMVATTVLYWGVSQTREVTRQEGFSLTMFYVLFLAALYKLF